MINSTTFATAFFVHKISRNTNSHNYDFTPFLVLFILPLKQKRILVKRSLNHTASKQSIKSLILVSHCRGKFHHA